MERTEGFESDLRLLPATQAMIREVEATTGKPVVVRAEPGLLGKAHAAYAASDRDRSRHLVLYAPDSQSYLNHLIPHELGHVLLFAGARSDDALVPHIGPVERQLSRSDLRSELTSLTRSLLRTAEETNEVLDLWSDGVTMQLANYPQDMLIERRIFEEYPELRSSQRESITRIAQEAHDGLNGRIVAMTPRSVTLAAQSMNYALLKSCARFLQEPWMTRPYRGTPFETVGEELLDRMSVAPPDDLSGCITVSRAWGRRLGTDSWFRWGSTHSTEGHPSSLWER